MTGWILISMMALIWLADVLLDGLFAGSIIWFVFGGSGFWISRFFPWLR